MAGQPRRLRRLLERHLRNTRDGRHRPRLPDATDRPQDDHPRARRTGGTTVAVFDDRVSGTEVPRAARCRVVGDRTAPVLESVPVRVVREPLHPPVHQDRRLPGADGRHSSPHPRPQVADLIMARRTDLGPDSMLWRLLADRRYLFVLPRAVCLLMLHPGIAAGITEHALMRDRIWLHKKRTVTQAVNYAYTAVDMRPQMRFSHEHVKGVDGFGQKYHALNPEIFHFQHAAYVESVFVMANTFIRPLDADAHEQLYRECCAWCDRHGIAARSMPPRWTALHDDRARHR